jgi:small subunit ribosomal protein S2
MIHNMLDAGVHFGHRAQRWNPAMAPYIYGQKYGIHIIDILKSLECLQAACAFVQRMQGKKILFVGTKRAASYLIELAAGECSGDAYFVNHRWLGGFLTNWETMRGCIYRLNTIDPEAAASKKERLYLSKQQARLDKFFRGVKTMRHKPDLLVIVGQQEEMNAVREARTLKIPTVTLVDTDCNPKLATYCIPANDDSVRSIQLILSKLVQARNA